MTVVKWEVRAGAYYDSVVLMQLQRGLLGLPGVVDAGVVMATPPTATCSPQTTFCPNPSLPTLMTCSSSSKPKPMPPQRCN
jgi:hypothetical protein